MAKKRETDYLVTQTSCLYISIDAQSHDTSQKHAIDYLPGNQSLDGIATPFSRATIRRRRSVEDTGMSNAAGGFQ